MIFTPLPINGLTRVTLEPITDTRGFLAEVFRADFFGAHDLPTAFVHHYQSTSHRGVLRGLHFQYNPPLGKLVRVTRGRGYLVTADIRTKSPTFGTWHGEELSADVKTEMYVPAGCAIALCALEDFTQLECMCTDSYNGSGEGSIAWNDQTLNINWPVAKPILSDRDRNAPTLNDWLLRPESKIF